MSLDQVVQAISPERQDLAHTVPFVFKALSSHDICESAPDALKHKFMVRISGLLKGKGASRAFGAYLAATSLDDWSVIKSHGATWAQILIHLLDLPDETVWVPAIKALTKLFTKVHSKQDLLREVGNSKVNDYLKRLLPMCEKVPHTALPALTQMLHYYPGPARALAAKAQGSLAKAYASASVWRQACYTYAELPRLEKQPQLEWRRYLDHIIADLSALLAADKSKARVELSFPSEQSVPEDTMEISRCKERAWFALATFIRSPPAQTDVKIPAQKIIGLINAFLDTGKSDNTGHVLEFLLATYSQLEPVYATVFESLLTRLLDATQQGNPALTVLALRVATALFGTAGWLSSTHALYINKLCKRALSLSKARTVQVEGLADFVDDEAASAISVDTNTLDILSAFFAAVITAAQGLPSALRAEIDRFLLRYVSPATRLSVVYPASYSILPLALERGMDGYEALVHPRFPALSSAATKPGPGEVTGEEVVNGVAESEPEEEFTAPSPPKEDAGEQFAQPEPETNIELPKVNVEMVFAANIEQLAVSPVTELPIDVKPQEPPEKRPRVEARESDGENEDFVMPTLTMDSDSD